MMGKNYNFMENLPMKTDRTYKRKYFPFLIVLSILASSQGCSQFRQKNAKQSVQNAEQRVLEELRKSVGAGVSIENSKELAEKLKISMKRANGITIGDQALGLFAGRLNFGSLDWMCGGNVCICSGDDDCNDLFSGPCSDITSNGVCFEFPGGGVVCMCNPR